MSFKIENVELVWSKNSSPSKDCSYDHCTADTPFGRFRITWKSWKSFGDPVIDETPWNGFMSGYSSVEEAKEAALVEYINKLNEAINSNSAPAIQI